MTTGIIVSLLTGGTKQKVSRILLSPAIYWILPKEEKQEKYKHPYSTVELANELLQRSKEEKEKQCQ